MPNPVSARLEDETRNPLDQLARTTQRSRASSTARDIREYLELSEWQASETRNALIEANGGDFVSDAEVKKFFEGWRRRAG